MTVEHNAGTIRRPRVTAERERELLSTALDVLREAGYEALTMEDIASRAHCGKATLYRLWGGKAGMIAAALQATGQVRAAEVDTGSLRGDLVTVAENLAQHAAQDTRLFAAMHHAVLTDPDLAAAVRSSLLEPDNAHVMRFIDRAVERGELPCRPQAADFLPQLFMGAVMSRPAAEGQYADSAYLVRFIDQCVLPALRNG
ncbi:TetR/AcrR family transcriptional regulator [Nonomuraea sp. NPDC050783]|uniref:TetR/AcrR family transcriptional regulator n=1 Tax=Nonomuraea sp. NPDC050783 TaxID=3154634 RepID=UPI003466E27F